MLSSTFKTRSTLMPRAFINQLLTAKHQAGRQSTTLWLVWAMALRAMELSLQSSETLGEPGGAKKATAELPCQLLSQVSALSTQTSTGPMQASEYIIL